MKKLKKILASLMVAVMVLTAAPLSGFVGLRLDLDWLNFNWLDFTPKASAESYSGTHGDNLTWTFDIETGELVISGTGAMSDYYYIDAPWDSYRSSIKTITISDGVTSIGSGAFYGCTGLTSITISDSVTSIGFDTFSGCKGLTSIIIPDSVTSIGDLAFYGCTSLASVTIPDSVTSISEEAFSNCTGLTNVTIGKRVTSIGVLAFVECINLTNVTIPDSVTSIGYGAFAGCTGLTSITIPDSVTSIGNEAFSGCRNLFAYLVKDSYAETYAKNNDIEYYYMYNGVEADEKIISVVVTSKLSFEINKETYTMTVNCTGNMLSFANDDAPWVQYKPYIKHIIINDGCTSISQNAFKGIKELKSIIIPDSVTSIGYDAFSGCTGLTIVTIPDSVTSIGYDAFYNCTGIKEITMPASAMIYNTFYNCTNIEKVTLTKGTGTMQNYDVFYVFTPWYISRNKCTEIIIEDGITNIGSCVFCGCTRLTSITIPDSVTSIGDSAFSGCTRLTSITIPDSVTSIGDSAFSGCTRLTSIIIPDSVTSIGIYAFRDCTRLESVTIGNSVTSIDWRAFYNCTGLTSITIPDSVTSIGDEAFYGCTGLTSVTIGDSVTSIGAYAFADCTNLGSVTLPVSVQSIGNNAFAGCQKIEKLKVYNRNCTFGSECISYYTTICGYAGSTAEAYATETGYNFELIPDDDHEHIYSNSCDAECNICGYINTDAGHTYSNDCDPECDVCGDIRTELVHTYKNDCDPDCEFCGYARTDLTHTDENSDGKCDVCEKMISDILVGVTQNFKVKAGETVYIKFVPANSGVYTFYSSSSTDTYGYVFNADKNQIVSDDDGGNNNNFSITYTFKSGTVYYLGVRYYSSSNSGEIPVTIRLDELICDHNNTHEEHQDSTCTENGYDKVVCDDCSQTVSTTELPLLDHDYKTITAPPTCVDEGVVVCLCKVCRDAYISEILDPLGHSELVWKTVVTPTTRREGTMNHICPACDEVFDTKTIPAITLSGNSTANVDFETNTISGFDSGSSSIDDYLSATNNGYTFTCESDTIGTGTVITLTAGEDMINEFEAVIFGDTNGDGWYDGQDAIIVDCLANGMLTKEDVGEAVYTAADCNHDGVIDQLDVDLLNQAGTLLANVDQSKPSEVLLETSSEYVEYLDLIDQSPEIDAEDDTDIPEVDVETEDTTPEQDAKTDIFEMILNFIKSIFEMLLSYIPMPIK